LPGGLPPGAHTEPVAVSLSKSDLPTPALLLDLDQFESNVETMQKAVSTAGKTLRPHFKAHKCPEITRRQVEAGAVGVCVATLAELRLVTEMGVAALLTTPVADTVKTDLVAAMASEGADISVVVDHIVQAKMYSASAASANTRIRVLLDLDVGDHRTGIPCDERALNLAAEIESLPNLRFSGLQAYSVSGSHTEGLEARRDHSVQALEQAIGIQQRLIESGFDAKTLTGGSTGTWNIDLHVPEFTELQAGSYPLMDVAYQQIVSNDFAPAMRVLATVVSASHTDRVTVDAGFKAFATDRPFGPKLIETSGVRWQWAGDEHGFLHLDSPSRAIHLADKLEFIAPHCDPTVNLYDRIHVLRGDTLEQVWPLKRLSLESPPMQIAR
jgi:D-serine deaminase-like pyridoxal phosphate-dependent protein